MTEGENIYTRTESLIGAEGMARLKKSRVLIVGVGGVGGYAAEAIARAGVGKIGLCDSDTVAPSNLNRQIIATADTVGMLKTEAARDRILSINPDCSVSCYSMFYSEDVADRIILSDYDYVVDAIDSVRAKLYLIRAAKEKGVRIISALGAGNKLDPTRFRVADISKTHTDPLARIIRTELRRLGILHHKVVFSDECARDAGERGAPASISFVPAAMGLVIASEVILELAGLKE